MLLHTLWKNCVRLLVHKKLILFSVERFFIRGIDIEMSRNDSRRLVEDLSKFKVINDVVHKWNSGFFKCGV